MTLVIFLFDEMQHLLKVHTNDFRMKTAYCSWDECLSLREIKVYSIVDYLHSNLFLTLVDL